MGFGYGGGRTSREGKSYNNDMTAHVWNAQTEQAGHSSNGNFFFNGRALYSYGSHFVVGYIMPDGVAFLNADSYSISTSGHQSTARSAVSNRRTVTVKGLTALAGDWKLLPKLAYWLGNREQRKEMQAMVRRELREHADALTALVLDPGEATYGRYIPYDEREPDAPAYVPHEGKQEAGAYLAKLAGLPDATWPKLKREAVAIKAKREAANVKAQRDSDESQAIQLADMPDSRFRAIIAERGREYNNYALVQLSRQLKRARSLALHATKGKLASKSRLATLRERVKRVDVEIKRYDAMKAIRDRRARIRGVAAELRQPLTADYHALTNRLRSLEWLSSNAPTSALRETAATSFIQVKDSLAAFRVESDRLRAIEAENRLKAEAERRELWLAGQPVGSIRFDADTGGPALRIVGDVLETSHGASVPLAHAIKVFRFAKLLRERRDIWRRNGKRVRVGHFEVDMIDADGNITAGCHRILWPEVKRVARIAGVFDCPASDAALNLESVA